MGLLYDGDAIDCSARRAPQVIEAKGRPKRNAIVVTELPYQVNKSALLQKIAEMVNDKKVREREHRSRVGADKVQQ